LLYSLYFEISAASHEFTTDLLVRDSNALHAIARPSVRLSVTRVNQSNLV